VPRVSLWSRSACGHRLATTSLRLSHAILDRRQRRLQWPCPLKSHPTRLGYATGVAVKPTLLPSLVGRRRLRLVVPPSHSAPVRKCEAASTRPLRGAQVAPGMAASGRYRVFMGRRERQQSLHCGPSRVGMPSASDCAGRGWPGPPGPTSELVSAGDHCRYRCIEGAAVRNPRAAACRS
jgi:hypothetical protein